MLISASLGNAAQEQHQGIARNKCFVNEDVEKCCCGYDCDVWPCDMDGATRDVLVHVCGSIRYLEEQRSKKSVLSCT